MVQTNSNTLPSWWDENYSAAREEYKGTAQLERTFGVEIEFLYTGTLSTRDLVKKLSTPTSPVVFKTYGEHFHSGYHEWDLNNKHLTDALLDSYKTKQGRIHTPKKRRSL